MAYARARVREVAHRTREQITHVVQRLAHRHEPRHEQSLSEQAQRQVHRHEIDRPWHEQRGLER